jgi:O-antigen/teichoic acid export membrane protein
LNTPLLAESPPRMELPPSSAGPRRLTLRANFLWTFCGNVLYSGCQWGMLVALARLGGAEMVGQFALGLAVTAPVFMFAQLQLRSVQATDARRDFRFGDYLAVRLLMIAVALLVTAGVVFASGYGSEVAAIILAVAAAKACECTSDILHGLLQQHEQMDRIALSMMLRGTISLAALGAGVWLTQRLLWGVLAMVASWAAVALFYDCPNAFRYLPRDDKWGWLPRPRWQRAVLGRLLWLTLPLGLVTCLISLNTNLPRYFVEYYLGLRELGIFSALGYLMLAGNTVANALAQSASPRLGRHYAHSEPAAFRNLLLKLIGLGILLNVAGLLLAVFAGRIILHLVYGPDYAEHNDLFIVLMLAAGISYVASFLNYGVIAARRFRIQTPVFISVSLITIVAAALLVPRFGLLGAGWTVLLTMASQCLLMGAVLAWIIVRMSWPEQEGADA